ncbi:MAG: hypothetical protein SWL02_11760, partial [Pseudomonadota bacterium]|nr:hypothetical protein [Pseudomonadota bacterium]
PRSGRVRARLVLGCRAQRKWRGNARRKHAVNTSLYAPPPHPCGGGFATSIPSPHLAKHKVAVYE